LLGNKLSITFFLNLMSLICNKNVYEMIKKYIQQFILIRLKYTRGSQIMKIWSVGWRPPDLMPIKYNNRWSYSNTILYKITIISCVYLIRWTRVNIYTSISSTSQTVKNNDKINEQNKPAISTRIILSDSKNSTDNK